MPELKKQLAKAFAEACPDMDDAMIAATCGVQSDTVSRWMKESDKSDNRSMERKIKDFSAMHPDMSNREIAKTLGTCLETVDKWLPERKTLKPTIAS